MPSSSPDEVKILPAYTLAEAARYVGVSERTLRTWFRGGPAQSTIKGAFRRAAVKPILPTEAGPREPLSFLDLIEAHVLFSLRKSYKFPMAKVRVAMEYLATFGDDLTALAREDFFHDHGDIYLGRDRRLLSLTERGQMADKTILESGLHQITYGSDGYANEFYPLFNNAPQRDFVINPAVNYGYISIAKKGIGADALAARYQAGEKMSDIAQDCGLSLEDVVESIRWHDRLAA